MMIQPSNGIIHVDYLYGTNNGTGSSWATATNSLADALKYAFDTTLNDVTEIKITWGTYEPVYDPNVQPITNGDPRDATFRLVPGVRLTGGYIVGGQGEPDPDQYKTLLFGNDYFYHLMIGIDIPEESLTVVSGITISRGNANGSGSFSVNRQGGSINIPRAYGGGIYNYNAKNWFEQCKFSNNHADVNGGAMYNNVHSAVKINYCIINDNTADNYGGGIYCRNESNVNIQGTTIRENHAGVWGGGMLISTSSSVNISFSHFNNNTADVHGGGLFNSQSSPSISDTTFYSNTANTNGGGIYNNISSKPICNNVEFDSNTANNYGGGMYCRQNSNPELENCTFKHNYAGLWGGGMLNSTSASAKLTECTFTHNEAAHFGGAMYNNLSSPSINNCIFENNTADHSGAIKNTNYSAPRIANCRFNDNTATYANAGAVSNNESATPTFINCLFYDNRSEYFGGAISSYSGALVTLINCTIAKNYTSGFLKRGAGIQIATGDVKIYNCIIWDNFTGEGGQDDILGTPSSGNIQNSCVPTAYLSYGDNNIDEFPQIINTGVWDRELDFRVAILSPCVNAGRNDLYPVIPGTSTPDPILDIQGTERIRWHYVNGPKIIDMGAYESVYTMQPW